MRFISVFAAVASIFLLSSNSSYAQSVVSTKVTCTGDDYLQTQLQLSEWPSPSPGARRFLKFYNSPGIWNHIYYDLTVEVEVSRRHPQIVKLCDITLYTQDLSGETRTSFFGNPAGPCLQVNTLDKITLGVQGPKPAPGQIQTIRQCVFEKFTLKRRGA